VITDDPYNLSDAELIDYDGTAYDVDPVQAEETVPTTEDGEQPPEGATEPVVYGEVWE